MPPVAIREDRDLSDAVSVQKKKGLDLEGNGMILVILASMAMMVMFIEIMLVPALNIIARDFNDSSGWISWVLSIYLLVGAVATPILGRLGDLYGKKRVLLVTMCIYILALVGCSLSWSLPSLIGFRAIQGIGMGMFPLSFGIVRDSFPKKQIPVAIGIISAMFSVGVSLGLLGGGYIVSVLSWRDSFYIVAPLFAVLTFASWRLIREAKATSTGGLDLPGSALLGLGVFTLLFALTEGETWGWYSASILALLVASLVVLVSFVLWERRSRSPIVRLSLLRQPALLGANAASLFVGLSMFIMFQTLPFYLMTPISAGGLGLKDTFTVGLYIFPSAASQLLFAPLAGRIGRRVGHEKVLISGLLVFALAFGVLIQLHSSELEIMVSMLIAGLGIGFAMVSVINIVALASPRSEFGVSTGMNTLFRVIGGSIGPVLATAILAGYAIPYYFPVYSEAGYEMAWLVGGFFAAVGALVAFFLRPAKGQGASDMEDDIETSTV